MFAYVGCYTTPDRGGRGAGIGVYRVDPQSGDWAPVTTHAGIPNPSFLALAPGGRCLYCVHGGNDHSAVSAFASSRPCASQCRVWHRLAPRTRRSSSGVDSDPLMLVPSPRRHPRCQSAA